MAERGEAIPAGRHGLSVEEVRAHRRARLTTAMVEAVALYGYRDATIERLVGLARIAKSDFYGVFNSKEECFWAAFEECLQRFAGEVAAKVGAAKPGRARLAAVIRAVADTIATEPNAVSLVLVDSLALGPEAEDPRARSQERFEAMLQAGVKADGGPRIRPLRAQGVVVGIRRLAYRAIRDSGAESLQRGAPVLADWALDCAMLPMPKVKVPRRKGDVPGDPSGIPWDEPPASELSRSRLDSRERIMRACAQLLVEQRDERLAIPAIPAIAERGGTSNQTLYHEFGGKEQAVLAAFDAAIEPMLAGAESALAACKGNGEEKVAVVIGELSARLAREPLIADLTFRAMPRVGRPGLERIDLAMDRLTAMLLEAAGCRRSAKRELRVQAAVGGVWGMMRAAVTSGDGSPRLPTRDLVDFALIGIRPG